MSASKAATWAKWSFAFVVCCPIVATILGEHSGLFGTIWALSVVIFIIALPLTLFALIRQVWVGEKAEELERSDPQGFQLDCDEILDWEKSWINSNSRNDVLRIVNEAPKACHFMRYWGFFWPSSRW